MEQGEARECEELKRAGVTLMEYFVAHAITVQGVLASRNMRVLWSENMTTAEGLYWLARVTGETRHRERADDIVRALHERTQRADGLWHHFVDESGQTGACWSRATHWPLLHLLSSLRAVPSDSDSAALIRQCVQSTFSGLEKVQHPQWGLWHLVLDEPQTRLESSASAGFIYCCEQFIEMGVIENRYAEMAERGFMGLKRLFYRGGLASNCRGTATGVPEYYRTRPMGYYDKSLFPAILATR